MPVKHFDDPIICTAVRFKLPYYVFHSILCDTPHPSFPDRPAPPRPHPAQPTPSLTHPTKLVTETQHSLCSKHVGFLLSKFSYIYIYIYSKLASENVIYKALKDNIVLLRYISFIKTNIKICKYVLFRLTYNFLEFFEHLGTHMDAPGHFIPGKQQMHEIPAHQLIGPGVIIDVKAQADTESTYGVTVGDIENYEQRFGRIPSGGIIIMNSGWGLKYPDKYAVFGTEDLSSMANFRFPGWTLEAAEFLMTRKLVPSMNTMLG